MASRIRFYLRFPPVLAVLALSSALIHGPAQAQTGAAAATAAAPTTCGGLYNFQFKRLQDDAPQNLCQYSGRVALVVNTASYCGYTYQYEGLEKLYARYRDRGLVVLGFPSNDFEQEPGDSKQIADFCFNTYGVKFPMFAKSHVKGAEANPLYQALQRTSGTAPRWNFHKYLIGRDGRLLANWPSKVKPEDSELNAAIEKALQANAGPRAQ
jgi:glutathione peroxidase